jgi:HAD superfamily hydrolase (TIGR01509 family)
MDTPQLVIFDCDGVLVDSEVIACRVDAACLAEIGIPITAEEVMERYVGISATSMFADIEMRYARRLPIDFPEQVRARLATTFHAELAAIPGVETALAHLSARRCVASSSAPERLRHTLRLVGLLPYFEPHIFSADQVSRGKPAPDLFLFASAQMEVLPEKCLVIEDSEAGVKAAVAAGMRVFGFTGGGHCGPGHASRLREAGASEVFDDMRNLQNFLTPIS